MAGLQVADLEREEEAMEWEGAGSGNVRRAFGPVETSGPALTVATHPDTCELILGGWGTLGMMSDGGTGTDLEG